jgi:hypothetical protein
VSRFRDPGAREAAWGRYYARKGLTAPVVLAAENPPCNVERIAAWREKHERLPAELKARGRRIEFRVEREPVDPDAYLLRSA